MSVLRFPALSLSGIRNTARFCLGRTAEQCTPMSPQTREQSSPKEGGFWKQMCVAGGEEGPQVRAAGKGCPGDRGRSALANRLPPGCPFLALGAPGAVVWPGLSQRGRKGRRSPCFRMAGISWRTQSFFLPERGRYDEHRLLREEPTADGPAAGQTATPKKACLSPNLPGPVHVTLFGKRGFADVMKDLKMSSSWIRTGPESNDQCVLLGDREVTDVDKAVAWRPAGSHQKPGEARSAFSPRAPTGNQPTKLIWDSVLWDSEKIHFWSSKPPGLWSFVRAEPGSGPIPRPEKSSFNPGGRSLTPAV
ncbi:uncharacterized protein LOC114201720 [Eumetopias jubatus]|uniref:uncharacterized protein LOC114201720 n=1 Tax=Eumetopias jubatus TaxID=34886 RepID=UPI00101716AE|nr:uncharacterized protein LOC114201720 [Eumetopias jubatus]